MTAPKSAVLDEATAWGLAQNLVRQALYRARVLAQRELQDLHLPVSVDLARTVLTWLIWDQSRGRAGGDHPGTRITASGWPTRVPEAATAYQRMLLEPLLDADPETQSQVREAALMIARQDQALIAEGSAHYSDGEARVSMTVDELALGARPVACPVCAATTDLRLVWDGYAATTSCPQHGEWLPGIGLPDWKWIYPAAQGEQ